MWSLVEEGLRDQFKRNSSVKKHLAKIIGDVEKGVIAPTSAAAELLELMHRP
jgi:hypothetical protein